MIFIVDTSEGMAAKSSSGITLLDLAKLAIEHAVAATRNEQHLLVTTESGANGVRVSWGESPLRFERQFKTLVAAKPASAESSSGGGGGGGSIAAGLAQAFNLLHQRRLQTGADSWGRGFAPWLAEPCALVLLTSGNHTHLAQGANNAAELASAVNALCGGAAAELCAQPWRWDQRLFVLSLVPAGAAAAAAAAAAAQGPAAAAAAAAAAVAAATAVSPVLKALAEETGGWATNAADRTAVVQAIETVVHRASQAGPTVLLVDVDANSGKSGSSGGGGSGVGPGEAASVHAPLSGLGADIAAAAAAYYGAGAGAASPRRAVLALRNNPGGWALPEPAAAAAATDNHNNHNGGGGGGGGSVPAVLPLRPVAQPQLAYRRAAVGSADPAVTSVDLVDRVGLLVDWYEVECLGPGLTMGRAARWPVYATFPQVNGAPSAAAAVSSSGANAAANKGSSGAGASNLRIGEAVGMLRAGPTAGRLILVLLPWDYPRLLPLLRVAAEAAAAAPQSSPLMSLSSQWRQDFAKYVQALPPYYFPPLKRALKGLGLQSFVPDKVNGILSAGAAARLARLRDDAAAAAAAVAATSAVGLGAGGGSERLDQAAPGLVVPNASAVVDLGQQGGAEKASDADGGILATPAGELLQRWDHMRGRIFGSGGVTVAGLFNAPEACLPGDSDEASVLSWRRQRRRGGRKAPLAAAAAASSALSHVLRECGRSLEPVRTTAEMSNYLQVLLAKDPPMRDPLVDPEPDEDTPAGRQRRQLSVNFGNPFDRGRRTRIFGNSFGYGGGESGPEDANMVIDEAADEAALLKGDAAAVAAASALVAEAEAHTAPVVFPAGEDGGFGEVFSHSGGGGGSSSSSRSSSGGFGSEAPSSPDVGAHEGERQVVANNPMCGSGKRLMQLPKLEITRKRRRHRDGQEEAVMAAHQEGMMPQSPPLQPSSTSPAPQGVSDVFPASTAAAAAAAAAAGAGAGSPAGAAAPTAPGSAAGSGGGGGSPEYAPHTPEYSPPSSPMHQPLYDDPFAGVSLAPLTPPPIGKGADSAAAGGSPDDELPARLLPLGQKVTRSASEEPPWSMRNALTGGAAAATSPLMGILAGVGPTGTVPLGSAFPAAAGGGGGGSGGSGRGNAEGSGLWPSDAFAQGGAGRLEAPAVAAAAAVAVPSSEQERERGDKARVSIDDVQRRQQQEQRQQGEEEARRQRALWEQQQQQQRHGGGDGADQTAAAASVSTESSGGEDPAMLARMRAHEQAAARARAALAAKNARASGANGQAAAAGHGGGAAADAAAAVADAWILPEGWKCHVSSRGGRPYFFHKALNQSLWKPPPGSVRRTQRQEA